LERSKTVLTDSRPVSRPVSLWGVCVGGGLEGGASADTYDTASANDGGFGGGVHRGGGGGGGWDGRGPEGGGGLTLGGGEGGGGTGGEGGGGGWTPSVWGNGAEVLDELVHELVTIIVGLICSLVGLFCLYSCVRLF
jgi:hypothetical protein